MSHYPLSRLSYKRIFITLLLFVAVRLIGDGLDLFVGVPTISYTFALNFIGWVMIIYDWNLFGIHYNRFKKNPGDGLLFAFIGMILLGGWTYVNEHFLHCVEMFPDVEVIRRYFFASPAIIIAFTFIWSVLVSLSFKAVTDRFDIRDKELLIILSSGFVFGLILTAIYTPLSLNMFVPTYLYNTVLIIILSYLYNQSGSLISGIIAYSLINLIRILMLL